MVNTSSSGHARLKSCITAVSTLQKVCQVTVFKPGEGQDLCVLCVSWTLKGDALGECSRAWCQHQWVVLEHGGGGHTQKVNVQIRSVVWKNLNTLVTEWVFPPRL